MKKYYVNAGSVTGECGHRHRSISTAAKCQHKHENGCSRQGGYSDRSLRIEVDGYLERPSEEEALEYSDELFCIYFPWHK